MDERQQIILHKLKKALPAMQYETLVAQLSVANSSDWQWLDALSNGRLSEIQQQNLNQHCAKKIKTAHTNIKKAGYQLAQIDNNHS
jgi:hypothetical protein